MTNPSTDPIDKLQAVITQRKKSSDGDPSPGYSAACREWFAKL
jgi:hypothetical protein